MKTVILRLRPKRIIKLIATGFLSILAAGCDSRSANDKDDAAVRSERGEKALAMHPISTSRHRASGDETRHALNLLESLAELHEIDEVLAAISTDERWDRVVKEIELDQIENLLRTAGFDESTEGGRWNFVLSRFRARKSQLAPHDFAEWLLETGDDQGVSPLVYMLAATDPELAIDVVDRSEADPRTKSDQYLSIMNAAAGIDPHRAARLLITMDLDEPSVSKGAALGLMSGINSETTTSEIMHEVLDIFPAQLREQHSEAISRIAGNTTRYYPVDDMLTHFPLDGTPWERAVAIQYLESNASGNRWGGVDMESFLRSDAAQQLSPTEIDRLNEMLRRRNSDSN